MRARILAVGIGDDKLVALLRRLAVDGHIGDARGECAAHADDLFVDGVGHAVRGVAQVGGLGGHIAARQRAGR